jgi:hypothetical protein
VIHTDVKVSLLEGEVGRLSGRLDDARKELARLRYRERGA